MTSTQREQLMMVVFPAAMVAIVWWGWLRPSAEYKATSKQLVAARANAISPQKMQGEQMKLAHSQAELKALETRYAQLVGDWDQLRNRLDAAGKRTHAIENLADLFTRHGLTLIKEEPLNTVGSGQLPTALVKAIEKMNRSAEELVPELKTAGREVAKPGTPTAVPATGNAAAPRTSTTTTTIWQVEFAGSFADVLAALTELRESDCHALPVSLAMKKAKTTTPLRRWTLLIRI